MSQTVQSPMPASSVLALELSQTGWPQSADRLGLHQLVEAQAARTPNAVAVVGQGSHLTYQALNQQANQLAHYLIELGAKRDRLIAVSLQRSPQMLVAFLGVLKAGAAYVPIDPEYPAARRQYILADARVEIAITQSAELAQSKLAQSELAQSGQADGTAQVICLDLDSTKLAQQSPENPNLAVDPEQLAYVIYTSGSTGNPKGVMACHAGLVNYSLALVEALALTERDRMLQFSTMSFDFIVSEIYPTLASGGALVLRSDEIATSTKAFLDFIAAEKVSVIQFTTAFWHELVSGLEKLKATLPDSLRVVLFGGEKASVALCRQWLETVGNYPRLFNAYGPTETTVITTVYDVVAEGYDGSSDLPIGRAIRNAKTYVLDEAMQPVSPGEPGELYIGGPGVTRGYLNLPEKTASVFVESPFSPGDRLYKTGDLVRMDESGLIDFVGRVDFQVKIRGFRIELGEIEACIDRYLPVQHRIVVAREDTPGDKRLVAYLVMKPGRSLDRADFKQFLQTQLPAFMMPSAVVVLPALPKNPNGKIDRKALPLPAYEDLQRTVVAPRTPLEEQLVQLWQSVLGIDAVGITDNFFELGGHSLLVMRLFSELEARFERRLPLVEIFAAPTIEQMAQRLAAVAAEAPPENSIAGQTAQSRSSSSLQSALTPLRLGTLDPPLFLVHDVDGDTGLYLHLARWLEGNRTVYGIRPGGQPGVPLVHSRIPDIARYCVEQIRQAQPAGPYLLGGLCAGGVIAFEIALQLERAGEQVRLVLMDSPAPTAQKKKGLVAGQRLESLEKTWSADEHWGAIARRLWQKSTNTLRYEIADKAQMTATCARARAFEWYRDRGWPLPEILQGLSVRELFMFAYHRYRPDGSFKGNVLLIRATAGNGTKADTPYIQVYADPLLGWASRCEQGIVTCDVPGGHSTMLGDAHVVHLAEAIESFIESADSPAL